MLNLLANSLKLNLLRQSSNLIWREVRYFRGAFVLAIAFTLMAAALEGAGIGVILSFLQSLMSPNSEAFQTGVKWFDVNILAVHASATERLYRISGLILLTTWLRSCCTYCSQAFSGLAQVTLTERLRERLFNQMQALSLGYYTETQTGELINIVTSEIYQVPYACQIMTVFATTGITMLVYLVALFLLSWQLSILSVLLFGLLAFGITALLQQLREVSIARSKIAGQYSSIALEFISGIRTVHAFAAQDFERQRFRAANAVMSKVDRKTAKLNALIDPITEVGATTILVGMLILAFMTLLPANEIQSATLLTFLFVLFRLMPAVRQINLARAQLRGFQGAFDNIHQLLRSDDKPYLHNGSLPFPGLQSEIAFQEVNFGYTLDEIVLHDITLKIPAGKMTALVGASGAGKSTLVDLIPRFYDPTSGQITLDGVDVRQFDVNLLRQKLAIVSQDTFIFNASVWENIAYALPTVTGAAVREAARLSNALEFIQELPQGFDTILGDRGVRLSGGQRQRIAIARALLRDPEILILDEATSALDSVSERLIQESLEKLAVGRTVIAIAHRLSTITRADQVIVLDRGRIVEQGTYRKLLEQRGQLWKYHRMQHDTLHDDKVN